MTARLFVLAFVCALLAGCSAGCLDPWTELSDCPAGLPGHRGASHEAAPP